MDGAYKLKQNIQRYGKYFAVMRAAQNEFGEMADELQVYLGRGLYHTDTAYFSVTNQEHGTVATKLSPKLLILTPDTKLRQGDTVIIGEHRYKLCGMDDPGLMGFCLDLSLEVL